MWFDAIVVFSMLFIVPWTKRLEGQTYVSALLSIVVIVVSGLIVFAFKCYYNKSLPSFSPTGVIHIIAFDFLGKGLLALWMLLALNFYFRDDRITLVTKKIEDNFKKGPKSIRYVIISSPYKMINIGKDYRDYKTIELRLTDGLFGFDVIESYELR